MSFAALIYGGKAGIVPAIGDHGFAYGAILSYCPRVLPAGGKAGIVPAIGDHGFAYGAILSYCLRVLPAGGKAGQYPGIGDHDFAYGAILSYCPRVLPAGGKAGQYPGIGNYVLVRSAVPSICLQGHPRCSQRAAPCKQFVLNSSSQPRGGRRHRRKPGWGIRPMRRCRRTYRHRWYRP